ncbi:Apc10DOC1 subunit of the anaphase-promoting complex, partial [Blyttiomyces helicus]
KKTEELPVARDISNFAKWSVSSQKPGEEFSIDSMRSTNKELFWQSDGPQPHFIDLTFPRKMTVKHVAIYFDHKNDESYTPKEISFQAGNDPDDLQEVNAMDLSEPQGWRTVDLFHTDSQTIPLRTRFLRVKIVSNHQNGKDTHVREMRVYGPKEYV